MSVLPRMVRDLGSEFQQTRCEGCGRWIWWLWDEETPGADLVWSWYTFDYHGWERGRHATEFQMHEPDDCRGTS